MVTAGVAITDAPDRTRRRADFWLSATCIAGSAATAAVVAFVVAVHIGDRYAVDHASGARIALARYAAHGVLYPPLVAEDRFGGTRFMPLPVVLHAGLARLTGEFLVSGKALALATMLAVGLVLFRVLRSGDCPLPLSVGLVAAVFSTGTGLLATTGLRGDSLPLLLQLLAVAVAAAAPASRRALWVAAALAALAVTAKLHAFWAPAAICAWLWTCDRRRMGHFLAAYTAITAVLLGTLTAVTRGRLVENVFGLSTAGVTGPVSLLSSPYRLMHLLVTDGLAAWLLLPLGLALVWAAFRRRSLDPWQLSLLAALAILLVVLTDIGTGGNQLLDIVVLTAVVVGRAAGGGLPWSLPVPGYRTALTGAVVWVLVTGLAVTLGPAVRDAAGTLGDPSRYRTQPLAGIADDSTTILSEDPYVPVSLGQDPVVLDPFMLPRIARRDPGAVRALVDRIDARGFDLVVLEQPLDDTAWWADYHFGSQVAAAIRRSYVFSQRAQGYDVYRPRPGG
jgi:hypothetical protein